MASSVGSRRSSFEPFDPTAYAARRREKVEAAAALREQRKKEQEKRESDRGAVPIPSKYPTVDYTFPPETPKQAAPTAITQHEAPATPPSADGPNYLKPLLRRSLTLPSTPPQEHSAESPRPSEAKPSPNSSSFAQALPPYRNTSIKKGAKKRAGVRSPPHSVAVPDGEESPPAPPPAEPEVEEVPAPPPEDDTENQAPEPPRPAVIEKKTSPARTALSLLKSKLRLSRPKPAAASQQENSSPVVAPPAPRREVLSPTQGQNQNASLGFDETPAAPARKEVTRGGGEVEEDVKKGGETGQQTVSLGNMLARALAPRKKKEAPSITPGGEVGPARDQPQGGVQEQPAPEWQAPDNELPEGGEVQTIPCPDCGRRFGEEALAKHIKICKKVFGQKRKTFNVVAHRLEGTEAAKFVKQPSTGRGVKSGASSSNGRVEGGAGRVGRNSDARPLKKVPAWKQQSQQLQAAIAASRQYSQAKAKGVDLASLPPPPPSENLDYIPCPHCSRKFAPQTAERHIPKCKDTVNRPKPVSRKVVQGGGVKKMGKSK